MEKLSIYELLSFIVPGSLCIELVNLGSVYLFGHEESLFVVGNMGQGMVFLFLALFFGSLIHILSFWLRNHLKWYRKVAAKPIKQINNDAYVQKNLSALMEMYLQLMGKDGHDDLPSMDDLFDFGYYYLESRDKISQAKSFQSLYFLFRNIFTLGLISILFLLNFCVFSLLGWMNVEMFWIWNGILLLSLCGGGALFIARWFRVKMSDRIFGNLYADLLITQRLDIHE